MGLSCQKCSIGVYNLCLGFCCYCKIFGMLGADCLKCRSAKHTKMIMKCLNPKLGTVYTCSDVTYNRYWFDSVQESFSRHARQLNQITRWNMESGLKEDGAMKKHENAMMYKSYDDAVSSLMKAYLAFTGNRFAAELDDSPKG